MPGPGTWWVRHGARDLSLGLTFFLVGLIAVFLAPMGFLAQVLLGAPIFEEALKFGLALLLAVGLGARHVALRLPLAWLAGGGFGVLEHYWGYSDEPDWMFAERVAFHALTASLSMLLLHALRRQPEVAVRWGATVPSVAIHYLNNLVAVAVAIAVLAEGKPPEEQLDRAAFLPFVIQPALLLLHVGVAAAPRPFVATARWCVRQLSRHV